MIGLPVRVVIWSMVALGTIAAAAFSFAAPATASTSCKTVVVKVHAKHWVWRNERRHGKVVRVHVRVSYVKREHRKVCTTTSPTTTPTASTPASVVTLAALAPSFTQDPTNPLEVTYEYSASATTTTSGVTASDSQLPVGIVNFYSDGLLVCSVNVGGQTDGGACPVTYTASGAHTVITTYTSGSTSATTTETEQINPFTTTTSVTVALVAGSCSAGPSADHCDYVMSASTIAQSGEPVTAGQTVAVAGTDASGVVESCDVSLAPGQQESLAVYQQDLGGTNYTEFEIFAPTGCLINAPSVPNWTFAASYAGAAGYLPSTSQPVTVQSPPTVVPPTG